jgi:hypothetical protein
VKRTLWLGLLLAITACGGKTTPPPRPPQAVTAPPSAAGQRAALPNYGISALFPGAPQVATARAPAGQTAQLTYKDTQSYLLLAMSTGGKDRATDDQWYESVRTSLKLEKRGEFAVQAFRGVEVGGLYQGREMLVRLLAVGDTLFTIMVDAAPGKLDAQAARRFLTSLELELPWRIDASPTTGFSIMVPTHTIEVDRSDPLNVDSRATTRAFFVGGRDAITYWATAQEIVERSAAVSDDQLLDAAITLMQNDGSEITFQGPVEMSGMRGREFFSRKGSEALRGRMLIGRRFLYLTMISGKSEAALRDVQVSKFYDSLVCY